MKWKQPEPCLVQRRQPWLPNSPLPCGPVIQAGGRADPLNSGQSAQRRSFAKRWGLKALTWSLTPPVRRLCRPWPSLLGHSLPVVSIRQ